MTLTKAELAQKIDHTLLKPTLLTAELVQVCKEAAEYRFKSVCIPPSWVKEAVYLLEGTGVDVITVVGFPLGYNYSEVKALEARGAIQEGAKEIDMVLNISHLKSGHLDNVRNDIIMVRNICNGIPLKVILETAYLTQTEKLTAALLAESAGADFIKTSTGFATASHASEFHSGAVLEDIQLFRQHLKPATQIKASGGIRDFATAIAMLEAGANRLGTSSGVAILNGLSANEGAY